MGTTDAVGNPTTAQINYRVLQPWLVTDANQNRAGARFDALGQVTAAAVMGKETAGGGDEGDHLDLTTDEASATDDPTTTYDYDLKAYSAWANDAARDLQHPVPVWPHSRQGLPPGQKHPLDRNVRLYGRTGAYGDDQSPGRSGTRPGQEL